ncbi:MAG: arylsulfatase [Bacteroidetes bacterium]|nr:arylsulfatase [Bacteroidota bacterium]
MVPFFLRSIPCLLAVFFLSLDIQTAGAQTQHPNILVIYTDDVGYGDLSANGGRISTPHIDRLARNGLSHTNAHATASTCTPSRYSLLTGEYAWRRKGTGIARGDASMIIPVGRETLPKMLHRVGYRTGVVGKWHLGLGGPEGPDWNGSVFPGPNELGFDYSYIMAATGDRVPCVYLEDGRVQNLTKNDPIRVDYERNIGNEPTALSHPQLLKLPWTHGHNNSIVNGTGRIGFMSGGHSARWRDEDMADSFTSHALRFIDRAETRPFFLYFATHDIHVPRLPHERFHGKSGFGPRGDALLELDDCIGRILGRLEALGRLDNTLIVFTSDNGPVLDDGYVDQAVEQLGDHRPWGIYRGGKYSAFEAGTRVPMIVQWPGHVRRGMTDALISQVDLLASLASLLGQTFDTLSARDSEDHWKALAGLSEKGRQCIALEAISGTVAYLRSDGYKYIPPSNGPAITNQWTNIETGFSPREQLYQTFRDPGERIDLAARLPELTATLRKEWEQLRRK